MLKIGNNNLGDACMPQAAKMVTQNVLMSELDLKDCNITDEGFAVLATGLMNNFTINDVSLVGNKNITEKSVPLLIELMKKEDPIWVSVDDTSITGEQRMKLALEWIKKDIDNQDDLSIELDSMYVFFNAIHFLYYEHGSLTVRI